MPFYISSCLFASYILCVLRGLHMCRVAVCVCCAMLWTTHFVFLFLWFVSHIQCSMLDAHFIFWSFVQINLIIWRHTSIHIFQWMWLFFQRYFNVISWLISLWLSRLLSQIDCISRSQTLFFLSHISSSIWLRQFKFVMQQVQYHFIICINNICSAISEMPKIKTDTA